MYTTRRRALIGLSTLTAGIFLPAASGQSVEAPPVKGSACLTVAGKIGAWNRGPATSNQTGFFKHHSISFDKALAFDRETLARMPQRTLSATTTETGAAIFAGPLLKDVLAEARADNSGVRLIALDGFAVELSTNDLGKFDWTLAMGHNGAAFGIGDLGPLWLMHTPTNGISPSEEEAKKWVWSVFYIEVI